jgi:hypothetical protein
VKVWDETGRFRLPRAHGTTSSGTRLHVGSIGYPPPSLPSWSASGCYLCASSSPWPPPTSSPPPPPPAPPPRPSAPPLRLLSSRPSPHLRLNRTGTASLSGLCNMCTDKARLTFACRLHSQGGGRSRWSARPRPTPKTVRDCVAAAPPLCSIESARCSCLYWRSQLSRPSDACFVGYAAQAKGKAPDKAPAASGSSFNQLLGIKGAKQESVSPPPFHPFPCIRYCNGWFCGELGIQHKSWNSCITVQILIFYTLALRVKN